MKTLLEALADQYQIDEDGTRCGVSRQAVDEAITLIQSQQHRIAALEAREIELVSENDTLRSFAIYAQDYSNDLRIVEMARRALAGDA